MSHLRLCNVGDYVKVSPSSNGKSEGGTGWIKSIDGSIEVEYVVQKKISKNVDPNRIVLSTLDNVSRKRATDSQDSPPLPSLLSPNYLPTRRLLNALCVSNDTVKSNPKRKGKHSTDELLQLPIDDMYNYLVKHQHDKGWLRRVESPSFGPNQQLSLEEKQKIMHVRRYLNGNERLHSPTQVLASAWGVDVRTIRRLDAKGVSLDRKKRSDAGASLLTSTKKQKQTLNSYQVFKKVRCRESHGNVDRPSVEDLKVEFNALSPEDRQQYENISINQQQRIIHLTGEIEALMQRTDGTITFRQLEISLSERNVPIMSATTLRKTIMSLPGSKYESTRLLPALTKAHKTKRLFWCWQFRIFWDNAKQLNKKTLVLLVHMDEKWFFGVVVRMYNKVVPLFGVKTVNHDIKVHHKSHLNKLMVLNSTYFLVLDGIDNGGRAFHSSLQRAGHMKECTETTYKRVTSPDGTASYPKIRGNECRLAGQYYFTPCDVTGATQQIETYTKTKKGEMKKKVVSKYSLFHDWFMANEIPRLEHLQRQLIQQYNVDITIRYQWDNAGPHDNKELKRLIRHEFDERGWLWCPQPPQSPLLNVHDCNVFAALAKMISNKQGLANCGNTMIDIDSLWNYIHETYYSMPLDTIGRAFAYHTQMANAIHECQGGDEYCTSMGKHCGVRRSYLPTYKVDNVTGEPYGEPIGVEMVEIPDSEDDYPLKYKKPIVDSTSPVWMAKYLSIEELEFFEGNLDTNSPEWQRIAMAITIKQQQEDSGK